MCNTIYYMRKTLTISLPEGVSRKLDRATRRAHSTRSDVVREALSQYFIREEISRLRARALPYAKKRRIYSDEDVFKRVS